MQAKHEFPNKFGVSVVKGDGIYGFEDGLYELAVTYDGQLTYDTDITDDVIGHLDKDDIGELLRRVEGLNEHGQEQ